MSPKYRKIHPNSRPTGVTARLFHWYLTEEEEGRKSEVSGVYRVRMKNRIEGVKLVDMFGKKPSLVPYFNFYPNNEKGI